MGVSFKVYIDESGDDGFSWDRGGSSWFTLSAVVTRKSNDVEVVKLVDKVNADLGRPIGTPLHFRNLRHELKLPVIGEIARNRLRTVTVLVHKPSISAALKFKGKRHSLYFYVARFLLERVSWLCRDERRVNEGDGRAEIVFSNRSEMKYEEFRDYLRILRDKPGEEAGRVEWSVIDCDLVSAQQHAKSMGLQVVDSVASGFQRAVEPQRGFTEDRYARMLKPTVYAYNGRRRNNGLKIWPGEVYQTIETNPVLTWVREVYPE